MHDAANQNDKSDKSEKQRAATGEEIVPYFSPVALRKRAHVMCDQQGYELELEPADGSRKKNIDPSEIGKVPGKVRMIARAPGDGGAIVVIAWTEVEETPTNGASGLAVGSERHWESLVVSQQASLAAALAREAGLHTECTRLRGELAAVQGDRSESWNPDNIAAAFSAGRPLAERMIGAWERYQDAGAISELIDALPEDLAVRVCEFLQQQKSGKKESA